MHIIFVLRGYPTSADPYQPFSRELISQIAKQGIKCSVIAPQSITRALKHRVPIRKRYWKDYVDEETYVEIYQPCFVSTSTHSIGFLKDARLRAAKKAFKLIKGKVDAFYGHFWDMGVLAAKISRDIPVYIGCGEAYIDKILTRVSSKDIELLNKNLAGVIYVSTSAYHEACKYGLQKNGRYLIAPNGYNPEQFYPMNKESCRTELGWSKDDFVVSFVGSFDDRKGVHRLVKAVEDDPDIKLALIGKGDDIPKSDQILFSERLPHDQIVRYLNASDVFVLPTQAEGCCNAIVEAIGCELPIISSDGEFNDDILDESNSIRINPNSVEEIRNAILELRDDVEIRKRLSDGSARQAKNLSIEARAKKILDFMRGK